MGTSIKIAAADLLDATAGTLRRRGWVQGSYEDLGSGRLCAVGALDSATRTTGSNRLVYHEAIEAFRRTIGMNQYGLPLTIVTWNDTPGRTVDEVLDVLEKSAKELRNEAAAS